MGMTTVLFAVREALVACKEVVNAYEEDPEPTGVRAYRDNLTASETCAMLYAALWEWEELLYAWAGKIDDRAVQCIRFVCDREWRVSIGHARGEIEPAVLVLLAERGAQHMDLLRAMQSQVEVRKLAAASKGTRWNRDVMTPPPVPDVQGGAG